jgi:hypothetical protein
MICDRCSLLSPTVTPHFELTSSLPTFTASSKQSFTAGRTGDLKAVDILMGVRYPCESLKGRITVRHGVPSTDGDEGSMGASTVLLSQDAMTTCPDSVEALQGACANGDCLRWQEFELSETLSLTKGEVYSFVLEGFYSADMTRTARVGVSPFSENNGGHSSLVVSPVYKVRRRRPPISAVSF